MFISDSLTNNPRALNAFDEVTLYEYIHQNKRHDGEQHARIQHHALIERIRSGRDAVAQHNPQIVRQRR